MSHSVDFVPFHFSTWGSFRPKAEGLLPCIYQGLILHFRIRVWEAHDWVFRRLSFMVMRRVAEQLVDRQMADVIW